MSALLRTPPQPLLGSILIRSILVWTFVRVVVLASATAGGSGVSALVAPAVILVVVAVLWLDLHRRDEVTFLRTLGVGSFGMLLPTILCCSALEALLLLLHAV